MAGMDPLNADEFEAWVILPGGEKAARVRVTIVTEGLPGPHEADDFRQPNIPEFQYALSEAQQLRFTRQSPFS